MEKTIWLIREHYNGYCYAYDNLDSLKLALGDIAFQFWKDNDGDLKDVFNDMYTIEEIPLNKNLP